ncbi:MAG: hypothetical protein PF448_06885 [Bacteroidales bacterium]|jgi:hypothetical protein|nr:hypothetical protein [Bacteroidales bacterium]
MKKQTTYIIIFSTISIVLLALWLFQTPNFFYPKLKVKNKYSFLFKNESTARYAFGNFKNDIFIYDIGDSIRTWVWKFNEFEEIPIISDNVNYSFYQTYFDDYYGTNPKFSLSKKTGHFDQENLSITIMTKKPTEVNLPFCHISQTPIAVASDDNYLAVFSEFSDFLILNKEGFCEAYMSFKTPHLCTVIFLKYEADFFIIAYYGINNYEINKNSKVLNPDIVWFEW